jgi:putative aminopeptidase FrvX
MRAVIRFAIATAIPFLQISSAFGQRNNARSDWEAWLTTPSVSGYESFLTQQIRSALKDYLTKTDNLGNVYVTLGSGSPRRLIVTPIDQPGYVVSDITSDGYLRVQRLPQRPPSPTFDSLNFAQPVLIQTINGKNIPGVFAGLSVHLQPLRHNPPKMLQPEDLYVDIGAKTPEGVRAAGVDLLNPVTLLPSVQKLAGNNYAGPGIGDHFGVDVLVRLLHSLASAKGDIKGTLTIAFVTQSWTGGRGFERMLREASPDEVIYVGRLSRPKQNAATQTPETPGGGVLLGVKSSAIEKAGIGAELKALADRNQIRTRVEAAELPHIGGYVEPTPLPQRSVVAGVATKFPVTPAETLNEADASELRGLLYLYLTGKPETSGMGGGIGAGCGDCGPPLIGLLTEAYGASGHESAVRESVTQQLPDWARKKLVTDKAGNLILHLDSGSPDSRTPGIAFLAHMDELGYEVKAIEDDGRLKVEELGSAAPQYFLGHPVLVHTKSAGPLGGVLELPEGFDTPGFDWQSYEKTEAPVIHVYVGTKSKAETEKLGIAVGDFTTIPKEYRPLLSTRANARSFDDRVGCASLVMAVRELGPDILSGRDVTFVWSTEEEVGLKGAAAFAENAAKEARIPQYVFAIDTFVSSDSPLESERFADAKLGAGFVIRAVDNSNVAPTNDVDRVIALANTNGIPVQYGVTGGGNDGSVFLRYGSVDIPLGWPLRYSHSPAEVIDTKDLEALGKIVEVIAQNW